MQYKDHIYQQLVELARQRYPGSPQQQQQYIIGFLVAQVSECWLTDSRCRQVFNRAVQDLQQGPAARG